MLVSAAAFLDRPSAAENRDQPPPGWVPRAAVVLWRRGAGARVLLTRMLFPLPQRGTAPFSFQVTFGFFSVSACAE